MNDPLGRRDPDFIRRQLPLLGALTDAWFAPEVDGLDHVPAGRALLVGTHNGANLAPDMFALMVAWWRRLDPERPAYGLAHDLVFRTPLLGSWIARLGGVPAHPAHAGALLARDAAVLVYPGGDLDAFKPFRDRHRVVFGERRGFVRTALRAGAPIVPVVSVGAHETVIVLTDGQRWARRLGLKRRLRLEVLPLMAGLPWGLFLGPYEGHLPLPSKIRIRVLPPLWPGLPPAAADDPAAVDEVREAVRRAMQAALDELVAAGGFGLRARLRPSGRLSPHE